MIFVPDFAAPTVVSNEAVDPNAWAFLSDLYNGISEGGKIIISLILLLGALLFFFGRAASKKLTAIVDASIIAAAEARKAKEEAAAAKTQARTATTSVTNSHTTHIREDIDGNQAIIMAKLETLATGIAEVRSDVGGIRSEIREDRRRTNALAERVNAHIDQPEGV